MRLRPYAPLAVVGAGLLIISVAPRPASASDADAPASVQVTTSGDDLLVDWEAPDSTAGLTAYDVQLTDAAGGAVLLDRAVDPGETQALVAASAFAGRADLVVRVSADFSGGVRAKADPVRVALAARPARPTTSPALQAAAGVLSVRVAKEAAAPAGTGRVLRIQQDGRLWATVPLPAGTRTWSGDAPAGHEYRAAYQVEAASGPGPVGPESGAVTMAESGPSGVRIRVRATDDGLKVSWSAAEAGAAEVTSYRVGVVRDGTRIGSGYTAAGVRSITLPESGDGEYRVTVVAKDGAGGSSASTATVRPAS